MPNLGDFLRGQLPDDYAEQVEQYVPPDLKPQQGSGAYGPYSDGAQTRWADPTRVYRILILETEGDYNTLAEQCRSQEVLVRMQAEARLVGPARKALGILPFDHQTGLGLHDDQVLDELVNFARFMNKKKEQGSTSPADAPPTADPFAT